MAIFTKALLPAPAVSVDADLHKIFHSMYVTPRGLQWFTNLVTLFPLHGAPGAQTWYKDIDHLIEEMKKNNTES